MSEIPLPQEVRNFHARDDVDSSAKAHHHTLGIKHDQASPGDHKHNGKNSKKLFETGVTSTGAFAAVNTNKTIAETFKEVYLSPPKVFVQAIAASAVNIGYPTEVDSITTTGFNIQAARAVGTGAFDVQWVVF